MSRWRLGLDWWDVGIHAFVTICLVAIAGEMSGPDADLFIPGIFAGSAVLLGVRRRFALRRRPPELTTGEVEAERLEYLEVRLADLEATAARLIELEERMDFAERLLARRAEPELLRGEPK